MNNTKINATLEILANQFIELEKSINQKIDNLFGGNLNV